MMVRLFKNRLKKRIMALVLAALMLWTMGLEEVVGAVKSETTTLFEEILSEEADQEEDLIWIKSGETVDLHVEEGGTAYVQFRPEVSGTYVLETLDSGDTYGTLIDADDQILAENDDDGEEHNFQIIYELEAGEVYSIGVRFYNSGEGNVTLSVWQKIPLAWKIENDVLTISGCDVMDDYRREEYYDTEKKVLMEHTTAPWGDRKFSKVVIEDGIKNIGEEAFACCTNLVYVEIAPSVTKIGSCAFYRCVSLIEASISEGVKEIVDNPFIGCTSLATITIAKNNKSYVAFNGMIFSKEMTTVVLCPAGMNGSIEIPESVTEIGRYAFYGCKGMTSVEITSNVKVIDDNAFGNCIGLTSVSIPSSVTKIGYNAFGGCTGLKVVGITEGLTEIDAYAFYGCTSLTSLEIPSSVLEIGECALSCCDSLETITVSEENDAYSSFDGMLFDKEQTELVACPTGKKGSIGIPEDVTIIADYAFRCCKKMTSVDISSSVLSIGRYAFRDCTGLKSVEIPESVINISHNAFCDCKNLDIIIVAEDNETYAACNGMVFSKDMTELVFCLVSKKGSVEIPFGVTEIGEDAFFSCNNMTSVEIPSSVRYIGTCAFDNCTNLTKIAFNSKPTIGLDTAFDGVTATVTYYPADGWTNKDLKSYGGKLTWIPIVCESHKNSIGVVAIEATCTAAGYTEGKKCADCKTILEGCERLPVLGHTDEDGDRVCDRCGEATRQIMNGETKAFYISNENTMYVQFLPEETGTYVLKCEIEDEDASGYGYLTDVHNLWIHSNLDDEGDDHNFCRSYNLEAGELYYIKIGFYEEHEGTISVSMAKQIPINWKFEKSVLTISGNACMNNYTYELYYDEDMDEIVKYTMAPWGQSEFTKVVIKNGVKSIGNYAFANCPCLTSVVIPASVTNIGIGAFLESGVTDVYYGSNEESWNNLIDEIGVGLSNTAVIHYNSSGPESSIINSLDYLAFADAAYSSAWQLNIPISSSLKSKWNNKWHDTQDIEYSDIYIGIGDWKYISGSVNFDSGFHADAFQKGKNIVITYRGSELNNGAIDWIESDLPAYLDNVDFTQLSDAISYYNSIANNPDYSDCTITLAGHSLGGALADIVAIYSGCYAETFNAAPFIDILFDYYSIDLAGRFDGFDAFNFVDHVHVGDIFIGGYQMERKNVVLHTEMTYTDSGYHNLKSFVYSKNGINGLTGGEYIGVHSSEWKMTSVFKYHTILLGSTANDVLRASSSSNSYIIYGGVGDDSLYGSDGNDILVGGNGSNVLDGGHGDDIYCYSLRNENGCDIIHDISGQNQLNICDASSTDVFSIDSGDDYIEIHLNGKTIVKIARDISGSSNENSFVVCIYDEKENIIERKDLTKYLKDKKFIGNYKISCPVDIQIYDSNYKLVYTLKDGEGKTVYNEYGNFYEYYENGEYKKIIDLVEGYTLKIVGCSYGTMDVQYQCINRNGLSDAQAVYDVKIDEGFTAIISGGDTAQMQTYSEKTEEIQYYNLENIGVHIDITTNVSELDSKFDDFDSFKQQKIVLTARLFDGYEFDGWYNGEKLISNDYQYTFVITDDITIEARYKIAPLYIYFVAEGILVEKVSYTSDSHTIVEPHVPEVMCMSGKWSDYELSNKNITVYAQYQPSHTPGEVQQEKIEVATCTVPGSYEEVVYCTVCGEKISRTLKTVEKAEHTPGDAVHEKVINATCMVNGSYDEVVYCKVCGKELSRIEKVLEKTGHSFGTPVFERSGNECVAIFTCKNDPSHTELENCSITSEITKEPTVFKKGVRTYTATVEKGESIYSYTWVENIERLTATQKISDMVSNINTLVSSITSRISSTLHSLFHFGR